MVRIPIIKSSGKSEARSQKPEYAGPACFQLSAFPLRAFEFDLLLNHHFVSVASSRAEEEARGIITGALTPPYILASDF
jgi:hypothetical protein